MSKNLTTVKFVVLIHLEDEKGVVYMFKDKIFELLKKEGITQRELANKIQINESALSRYISGERTPRIDIVTKLVCYFNVSVEELLDEKKTSSDYDEFCALVARNASKLSNEEISKLITLLAECIKNEIIKYSI